MANKTEKALAETLGIAPTQEIIAPEKRGEIIEPVSSDTADAEADYKLSRKTFRDLIGKGNVAIDHLFDLAKASEHPRAYEVLATLIKTVADTSKDLYDLQKKTKDLNKADNTNEKSGNVTVEKAVFVGSTAELLRKVKEEKQ